MSIRFTALLIGILSVLFMASHGQAAKSIIPKRTITGHISTIVFPKYIPPRRHYVNKQTGVWISGRGKCLKLTLDWGDGKPPTVLNRPTLPIRFTPHVYSRPGLFRITAKGKGCTGGSSANILIEPTRSLAQSFLCKQPKISRVQVLGGQSAYSLSPGGKFVIVGCGFGNQGIVRIINSGLPGGGYHLSSVLNKNSVRQWRDKQIVVVMPIITGVKDQKVKLFVDVKKTGSSQYQASKPYLISFRALRSKHTITSAEVIQTCGHRTSKCPLSRTSTMSAGHSAPRGTDIRGIDTIKLKYKLLNGWVLKHVSWAPHPTSGSTVRPIYKLGVSIVVIKVKYKVKRGGYVSYYLTATIEGPKGLPYLRFRFR